MNEDTVPILRQQSINSRCYCVAHDLSSQVHFHGTLSDRGQVGVSQLIQHTDHEGFVMFVLLLNVFPLRNNRRLAVQTLRLKLHIIFQKQVTDAL